MKRSVQGTIWTLAILAACGGEDGPTTPREIPDVSGEWSAAIVGTLASTTSASVDAVITATLTQQEAQFTGTWALTGTATLNNSTSPITDGGIISGFVLTSAATTVNMASGSCPGGMQFNGTGGAAEIRIQGNFVVRQSCNGTFGNFTGAMVFLRP